VAKLDTAWATAEIDAFLYVTERIPSKHTNVLGLFHARSADRSI
jgi:hypothetical protein